MSRLPCTSVLSIHGSFLLTRLAKRLRPLVLQLGVEKIPLADRWDVEAFERPLACGRIEAFGIEEVSRVV